MVHGITDLRHEVLNSSPDGFFSSTIPPDLTLRDESKGCILGSSFSLDADLTV